MNRCLVMVALLGFGAAAEQPCPGEETPTSMERAMQIRLLHWEMVDFMIAMGERMSLVTSTHEGLAETLDESRQAEIKDGWARLAKIEEDLAALGRVLERNVALGKMMGTVTADQIPRYLPVWEKDATAARAQWSFQRALIEARVSNFEAVLGIESYRPFADVSDLRRFMSGAH